MIHKIKNIVFYTVLGTLSLIGVLWFCRPAVSEVEKRDLTAFPEFSLTGLMDGSFAKGVDTWYADTYPLREIFMTGNNKLRSLYGDQSTQLINKNEQADEIPDLNSPIIQEPSDVSEPVDESSAPTESEETLPEETQPEETLPDGTVTTPGEMSGSIYITENSAYGLYYFVRDAAESYADMINHTYEVLGDKANVYCLIAPVNSGVMLDQSLLDEFGASNQKDAIDYIYSRMNSGVHTVNAFDNLKKHNAEYIYFRTDHHWTALGAYYAYEAFTQEKGIASHKLEQFEQEEFENFLGSFYASSQSSVLENNPDTVTAYVPMGTNRMTMITHDGTQMDWNIINDVSEYAKNAKYNCFSGSDQPYAEAHNPQITDGSSCVVIKDSYGNAFMPFLIDHYEYVYWIDFRHYEGTLTDLVNEKGIDDIIYCTNIYNTSVSSMVSSMRRLVP